MRVPAGRRVPRPPGRRAGRPRRVPAARRVPAGRRVPAAGRRPASATPRRGILRLARYPVRGPQLNEGRPRSAPPAPRGVPATRTLPGEVPGPGHRSVARRRGPGPRRAARGRAPRHARDAGQLGPTRRRPRPRPAARLPRARGSRGDPRALRRRSCGHPPRRSSRQWRAPAAARPPMTLWVASAFHVVLRHHADLLRERRASSGPRLHDHRRRRSGASHAPARRGRLLSHGDRRARRAGRPGGGEARHHPPRAGRHRTRSTSRS